jgi:hypothetical protein
MMNKNQQSKVKELSLEQIEMVKGGHPILIVLGAWGAAVEIYDFGRGVVDGFNSQDGATGRNGG